VVICLRELVDYLNVLGKLLLRLTLTLRIDLQWVVVLLFLLDETCVHQQLTKVF